MQLDWDPNKAASNLAKHDVSFDTASRVFRDPFVIEIKEEDHGTEIRYSVIGMVDTRLLHVTYAMDADVYRIISARAAEPYERRKYHEG